MKARCFLINSFIILLVINAFTVSAQTSAQTMYYQKLKTDLLSHYYQPVTEVNVSLMNGQLYTLPFDVAPGVTFKFFLVAPVEISASGIELQDDFHFRIKNNLLVRNGNTFLNELTYYSTHSGKRYAVFSCVNPLHSASDVNILIYKENGYFANYEFLPH